MSKKTAFEKTRTELGLPEREYTQQEQAVYNVVYKKLPAGSLGSRDAILDLVAREKLNLKQIEAGMKFLQQNEFNEAAFMTSCGIGVTYTDDEIADFCRSTLATAAPGQAQRLFSSVTNHFPWADNQRLKGIYDSICQEIPQISAKEAAAEQKAAKKAEKQAKEKAVPDELKLMPFEQLFALIPENSRYQQLPEAQKAHDEYLKELNANILTRFPPEPNGYLHLGHAKSMLINFGYAKLRGGKTYLRMDDTNPEKECEEYVQKIEEMMRWLGHEPFKVTHASDYFQRFYDLAEKMILDGDMYVEDFSQEMQKQYREARRDTPSRSRPPGESLRLFREMKMGLHPEGSYTVRMKIDNTSDNPNMRDPIAYRIKFHPHQQTGDEWCIYPVYDYVHCLNDAFEEITHSICTLEFNVRRESYDWLTHKAGGWRPMQWEFSRLNVTHTVMSKRRLLALVERKHVAGWTDPRMPTLVGLRRRGFTPSVINKFCQLCGVTRNDQMISIGLLEQVARSEYEVDADRSMAVLEPIKVELQDWSEDKEIEYPLHPQFPERGSVKLKLGRTFYIDSTSYQDGKAEKGWFALAEDQPCGLRYGPVIKVVEVVRENPAHGETKGKIIKLICTHTWDNDEKLRIAQDFKKQGKTLLHIHWVPEHGSKKILVRLYDKLFKSEDPMAVDDWEADLNPESLVLCPRARVPDYVAKHCANGEERKIYQFERVGFFVVDEESNSKNPVMNRIVALKSSVKI